MTSRNRHPRLSVSAIGAAPPCKTRAPLFRDFAARYRERRSHRWKPTSLKTFDGYMRNRLMPAFGKMRLDAIDHSRVSAWFDAASADRPGSRWADPFVSELCVLKGKRMRSCSPVTGAQIPIQQEQQRSGSSIHILAGH